MALDLGAGVGALGLAMAVVGSARSVALVEAEARLIELARDNLERNRVTGSVHAIDLARERLPDELVQRADLVVCNPPFYPDRTGTPARERSTQRARSGALEPFLRAAQRGLTGPRGRAAFCYPAAWLPELLTEARATGLVPKRLRLVHARADREARLALVELKLAKPGGLVIEPPLVEWTGRSRTPEVAAIVAGRFGLRAP